MLFGMLSLDNASIKEDFKIAFDDCKIYSYLKLRYSDYNNYNYEKSPSDII